MFDDLSLILKTKIHLSFMGFGISKNIINQKLSKMTKEGLKETLFRVVVNHEEQYSVWPANRPLQKGWKQVGEKSSLRKCLDFIEEVWTDMRP